MGLTKTKSWLLTSNKLERIWLLAKIEFKLRYYENKLGLLWALIKPLSDIFIYYVAFELVLKQGVPNFVSFLFIGLIIWNFFIESTSGTIQILQTKKYLYEYTNMHKIEIYLATILSNSIGFFFNFIMFCLYFYFFSGANTTISPFALVFLVLFINLALISAAFSLILSSLYVNFKDITQIWNVIAGIGFWLSPILFKLETFRSALPYLEYLNPVAGLIINTRNVLLYNLPPDWSLLMFNFVSGIVFFLIGLSLLSKIGSKSSEKL